MRDLLVKIALRLGIYQLIVEYINRVKFTIQSRRMHARRKPLIHLLLCQSVIFEALGYKFSLIPLYSPGYYHLSAYILDAKLLIKVANRK